MAGKSRAAATRKLQKAVLQVLTFIRYRSFFSSANPVAFTISYLAGNLLAGKDFIIKLFLYLFLYETKTTD